MLYGTENNRGYILVWFAHFFQINLKAFHLLSLTLYFFKKKNSHWYWEWSQTLTQLTFVSCTVSVLKDLSSIFTIWRISCPLERGNFICVKKYSLDKNVRVSGSVNGKTAAVCFLLTVWQIMELLNLRCRINFKLCMFCSSLYKLTEFQVAVLEKVHDFLSW